MKHDGWVMTLEFDGNGPGTEGDGCLGGPVGWHEKAANPTARGEISLTADHGNRIAVMRNWQDELRATADAIFGITHRGEELGYAPKAKNRSSELLSRGYAKQACRMSEISRPKGPECRVDHSNPDVLCRASVEWFWGSRWL
jgi:sulfur relay (sulfurtransferase) DsrC/TusE family protein